MEKLVISVAETGAVPGSDNVQTEALQRALDEVWRRGGGVVEVPAGRYLTGGLRLRSRTTLHLQAGAVLQGVRDPESYTGIAGDVLEPLPEKWLTDKCWEPFVKGVERCYDFMRKPGGRWGDAIIRAVSAEDVAIIGEPGAVIDGSDCYDPKGEESYRGPHGISMHHCKGVTLRGYTIQNTGNWAHCIFDTDGIEMEKVTVLAGHDGIHCTSCSHIHIADSEFYTGDDCIAGFANTDTLVERCICNTACSGMRFGGTRVLVRDCRFFGPARYFFRGSLSLEEKINGAEAHRPHRVNMLSVFTYYADYSVDIPERPGEILIKNCTVKNVDRFLHFNFSGNERWQSHRPLASIAFEDIDADGIGMPLTAYGSADDPLELAMRRVKVSFREDVSGTAFLHTANYRKITLEDVTVSGLSDAPLIKSWSRGGEIVLDRVDCGLPKERLVEYTDEPFKCKAF